jgi:diacylglycerol kinase family enzyme
MESRFAERPDPKSRRLLVSFSPYAGARSAEHRAREIVAELESAGFCAQATSSLEELNALATEGHLAGDLRCVLACGGDGTAAVVRKHTPLEVPLLLVPLGTENLLARHLSQSASPASVLETVEEGVTIALDLGRTRSESVHQHYFLTMISAGFDAEVVRRLHQRRRGNIRRISYVQPTLETIRSYEYPELQLYCHDGSSTASGATRCRWVFGFNMPLYACGWQLAPDADGTDGLLDVCTFEQGSLIHVVRYLWHVMWQSHLQLADAGLAHCRTLRIEATAQAEVPYQTDGDFAGKLPVDIDVLPGQLRIMVKPDVAERFGFS